MHLLLVGSGGREHALAWKLAQSERVTQVSVAPGNPGMQAESKVNCIPVKANDTDALLAFAQEQSVHLTIIGPEAPLVSGIVDAFIAAGQRIFGPCQAASALEGSKAFAKEFMQRNGIPTANHRTFSDSAEAQAWIKQCGAPIVIKADGLAAGKGVVVAHSLEEACQSVESMLDGQFGNASKNVVIEEFLDGEEASFIAIVSGRDCLALASSQDHKARDEGDKGPNTGGMGAYTPAPVVSNAIHDQVIASIVQPTINALAEQGTPFVGFLYVGLMIDATAQAKVVEYNVRLGDPETQPLMLLMKSDLLPLLDHAVNGTLKSQTCDWYPGAAIGVVLAADSYPTGSSQDEVITGVQDANRHGCTVFHAGTKLKGDQLLTAGGRVLCATARADSLQEAKALAEKGAESIHWTGVRFRRDIGHRAIAKLSD